MQQYGLLEIFAVIEFALILALMVVLRWLYFELQIQRNTHTVERDGLYRQIRTLIEELTNNTMEMRELRWKAGAHGSTTPLSDLKQISILACISSEEPFKKDLISLRRVRNATEGRVDFRRLSPIKIADFKRSVETARRSNHPYHYVHISAHMGEAGIQFDDGVVDASWVRDQLTECKILVLAGCSGTSLAEIIGNVVDNVITMSEDITHDDAALFAEAFWHSIGRGLSPEDAFEDARRKCPTDVREFVEMRS